MNTTLTNDQITAGAAVLDLADLDNTAKEALRDLSHIENHLQASSAPATVMNRALDVRMSIKELRGALASRAPSLQIAEKVELPPLDEQRIIELWDSTESGGMMGRYVRFAHAIARDAIAASRRATTEKEVRALDALDGMGFTYDSEIGWLPPTATAPASAGQAAPDGSWLWCRLMDWCKKRGVAPSNYDDLFAIAGEAHKLAAQPAEGAGQAGQVAKGPDQQQIEWGNDLQGRLIDLSQDMTESEDARQVMAEAACLLASLTGHAVSQ